MQFRLSSLVLACLVPAISISRHIYAQENDANQVERPKIYVPAELPPLAFGDPLFFPIAVANYTNNQFPADAEIAANRDLLNDADLLRTIEAGGEQHVLLMNQSFGGGNPLAMPAKTAQTTVLKINLWSPRLTPKLLEQGHGIIRLKFAPYPVIRDEVIPHAPDDITSEFAIEGSSLTPLGMQTVLDMAPKLVRDITGMDTYGIHTWSITPFSPGVTPLSWLTTPRESDQWRNRDSELLDSCSKLVLPGTKLARLLEISVLLEEIEQAPDFTAWKLKLSDFDRVINRCGRLESDFYIGELASSANRWPLSLSEKEAAFDVLRAAYPQYLNAFTREGPHRVRIVPLR